MHTPIHPSSSLQALGARAARPRFLPPLPTPPAQRPHRKLFTFHFSLFTSAAAASLPAIAALALALSLPPAARAQAAAAAAADPTLPSPSLASALQSRLSDLSDLALRALVVGPGGEGVALVGSGDHAGTPVRAGTTINQDIDGITVPLTVESVTPAGVLLRTSPTATHLLPSSLRPLPAQSPASTPAASESGSGRPVGHSPALPDDPPQTFHPSLSTVHSSPSPLLAHVEFTAVPLSTALRLIADQSGANISASASTATVPVSIFLRNVRPETAVEEICRVTGLWYRHDAAAGILRVTTMDEYEESLASFREEQTETYTLLYPNVLEVASVIYGLYPERVMLSLGEEQLLDGEKDDIARRLERFNLLADGGGSSSFMRMTPGTLNASSSGTGSSGTIAFNGGRVTVVPPLGRLAPADAARLADAEAAAPETFDRTLSDYQSRTANIFVTVSPKNSMLMVRTSDAKALEDIRALVRRLDVPTPMVLLEVKVLELALDDGFTSSFEYQFTQDYNTTDPKHLTTTAYGFPGLEPLSTDGRADSFTFRLLSSHLQMRIQMLETEGKAKTLATPLLLTANNEVSRLFIGEERPMVRNITSQTIANGDTTITVPQTEFDLQAVGTMLLITPNINADRTVTLRLLQENSDIVKDGATIPIYSATDGGIIQKVSIDVVSSRSITGTFIAKDNLVTAVGGLVKETETFQESRIPILGRIPLLGWFFRSTEKVTRRTELVVLIRPHVIATPSESAPATQSLLDRLSAHPARDGRPTLTPVPPTGAPSPAPSPWR